MFAAQIVLGQKMRAGLWLSDLQMALLLYLICALCGSDLGWLSVARLNQTFSQFLLPKLLFCDGPRIL